jgi:hypothetical protein
MCIPLRTVTLVAAATAVLAASTARAQPDLPPPPPPPMGAPTELPPLPPSPSPPAQQPAGTSRPTPRYAPQPQPPPPPPVYRAHARRRAEDGTSTASPERGRSLGVYVVEEPEERRVALTLNPLGLVWGRLSANVEVQLAPRHSLVVSPNALILPAERGMTAHSTVSQGLGFASRGSSSIGVELGYHYWWYWRSSLRGPFLGPSLLLGSTTQANAGDPTQSQTYWGMAFDFGWQEVLPGGFTIGGGAGLGLIHLADSTGVFPRVLFQIGWSF